MTTADEEQLWDELMDVVELSTTREPDLLFADSDAVVVERWEPPALPLDIELQHLLGGISLDVMPAPTEVPSDRAIAGRIRRLPSPLRNLFKNLKDHGHRSTLIDAIASGVRERVGLENTKYVDVPGDIFKTAYVPEVHRRAALARMAKDAQFLASLRREITRVKHDGHLINTYGGPPRLASQLPVSQIPRIGPWKAESWLGLATSSLPESLPEEVVVALAQRAWRRFRNWGRHRRPAGRVLHWGALNGTFAFALQALAPRGVTLVIDEVDTVGQEQSRSWKGPRSSALHENQRDYDLIVMHVPPPGSGANQLRNHYKDLASPTKHERSVEDMGRRGPRKWRRALQRLLTDLAPRLKADGELCLILPTSVRVAPQILGYPQWGYEPSAELLAGIVEPLINTGLTPIVDLEVDEVNPLEQPFFRARRCPWRLVILSRNTGSGMAEEDEQFARVEVDLG